MSSNKKSNAFSSFSIWRTHLVFWLGAIIVVLATVALTIGSEHASELFKRFHQQYIAYSFLLTPICLTALAWVTITFFSGSERSGIPQVKAALQLRDSDDKSSLLSIRIILGKLLLSMGSILSGAPVGLGGPAIHIGASLIAFFGRFANFGPHYLERGLILAGSSAGFAPSSARR